MFPRTRSTRTLPRPLNRPLVAGRQPRSFLHSTRPHLRPLRDDDPLQNPPSGRARKRVPVLLRGRVGGKGRCQICRNHKLFHFVERVPLPACFGCRHHAQSGGRHLPLQKEPLAANFVRLRTRTFGISRGREKHRPLRIQFRRFTISPPKTQRLLHRVIVC